MSEGPDPGLLLVGVLLVLIAIAVGGARFGGLRIERSLVAAGVRAIVQLAAVALVIRAVIDEPLASVGFIAVMFAAAVWTTASRVDARGDWAWVVVALLVGVGPVLAIVFASGVTPFTGPAIIPIAGIIIGGAMTAHTLAARRAFDALRADRGQVEAGLALGLVRRDAIANVIGRHGSEALLPIVDQTRTVGLVTLPGAFVGVLLGGGSPADAAAAQVLVLFGLLAAETLVVAAAQRLIAAGRIATPGLRALLPRS